MTYGQETHTSNVFIYCLLHPSASCAISPAGVWKGIHVVIAGFLHEGQEEHVVAGGRFGLARFCSLNGSRRASPNRGGEGHSITLQHPGGTRRHGARGRVALSAPNTF